MRLIFLQDFLQIKCVENALASEGCAFVWRFRSRHAARQWPKLDNWFCSRNRTWSILTRIRWTPEWKGLHTFNPPLPFIQRKSRSNLEQWSLAPLNVQPTKRARSFKSQNTDENWNCLSFPAHSCFCSVIYWRHTGGAVLWGRPKKATEFMWKLNVLQNLCSASSDAKFSMAGCLKNLFQV